MAAAEAFKNSIRRAAGLLGRNPTVYRLIVLAAQEVQVAVEQEFDHGIRSLYQMRCGLPLAEPELRPRAFRPGVDEPELLEVHGRAAAGHPEQSLFDLPALSAMQREPWFHPDNVLIYEDDGKVAGYCLTRLHHGRRGVKVGEIVNLFVDPDRIGQGIGRQLCLAGLAHLHHAGATTGMLYVEANNLRAVRLYISLGFQVVRVERRLGLPAPPVL